MLRGVFALIIGLMLPFAAMAQTYSVSGTVKEKATGKAVDFATVALLSSEQWAVVDAKGNFEIKNVPAGENKVSVSCLGFVTIDKELNVNGNISGLVFELEEDNLRLESAVVTAKDNTNSATTSRTIDKAALEHIQVTSISSVTGLLPGGTTSSGNLNSLQTISLRGGGSFNTSVEVDGVRLSNNSSFSSTSGVTTNNIASANVESVEIITGVPSVEYGDMTSGVVKINTRKGRTPWQVTMTTNPSVKQVSLSKGFGLGTTKKGVSRGVLNASAEYAKSISNKMSPYSSYDRKQISLSYSTQFAKGFFSDKPLRFTAGITGNLGGFDNQSDPDRLVESFYIGKDNALRGNISANWLLSKKWITNVEFNASVSYSDKLERQREREQNSTTTSSIHATKEGYYIAAPWVDGAENECVLIPQGTYYHTFGWDDRPLNTRVSLKANWAKNFGKINNKVKIGGEWTGDKNFGIGKYAEEPAIAPSWREYRYCDVPMMSGLAFYAEENFLLRTGDDSQLNLIAGIRNDNTLIPGSEYGTTSSVSPRFNAKYTFFTEAGRGDSFFRELSVRAGWGVSVKQPSYSILYPVPSYRDYTAFYSTVASDGTMYRAEYVRPYYVQYNSALRWQKAHQTEVGLDMNLGGAQISIAGYYTKSIDSYTSSNTFDPFTYTYTNPSDVQGLSIPVDNRVFSIDKTTGFITVSDKTNPNNKIQLNGDVRTKFESMPIMVNAENPTTRIGLEWVVDFPKIKAINTTIRLDGNFYSTRSVYTNMEPDYVNNANNYDGTLYRYLGWYYGGGVTNNGSESSSVRNNLSIITHIPKVGMVITLKLEASLHSYSRTLSERADGSARSYVISDKTDPLSIVEDASIYDGECYTVFFPEYYTTLDDPTPVPYLEKLRWAKENDPILYADLSMLKITNTDNNYTYLKDYRTPSYSAHFSMTKEIGKMASVSLYVNNFINKPIRIYTTKTDSWVTSYPSTYYGLTLRLKF